MNERKTTILEQGWDLMPKMNLEGLPQTQLSPEDYIMIYTAIYKMCTPKPSDDYTEQQFYGKFRETFEEYITSMVYGEFNNQVRDAVISMISRHREGEQIDQTLVKDIIDIYMETGEDSMKFYVRGFEEALLKSTVSFYSGVALNWITSYSYEDYMLKVEGCLKEEEERVSYYLQGSCQNKLLEVLRHKLLVVYTSKLDEKKQLDDKAA